jgi:hypothetical protein
MGDGHAKQTHNPRHKDDEYGQTYKQYKWIREQIPYFFNPIEEFDETF